MKRKILVLLCTVKKKEKKTAWTDNHRTGGTLHAQAYVYRPHQRRSSGGMPRHRHPGYRFGPRPRGVGRGRGAFVPSRLQKLARGGPSPAPAPRCSCCQLAPPMVHGEKCSLDRSRLAGRAMAVPRRRFGTWPASSQRALGSRNCTRLKRKKASSVCTGQVDRWWFLLSRFQFPLRALATAVALPAAIGVWTLESTC